MNENDNDNHMTLPLTTTPSRNDLLNTGESNANNSNNKTNNDYFQYSY